MNIAKLVVGAALVGAPVSHISAQAVVPSDSGNGGHRGEWVAGTAVAAGAGIFMAFMHTAHDASASPGHYGLPSSVTTPAAPTAPTTGLTPSPGGSTPPADDPVSPDTASDTTPPPADNPSIGNPPVDNPPTFTTDGPTGPANDPPLGPNDDPPHEQAQFFAQESSTVPEPGTLALTATGIIGLVPLVRRRRK